MNRRILYSWQGGLSSNFTLHFHLYKTDPRISERGSANGLSDGSHFSVEEGDFVGVDNLERVRAIQRDVDEVATCEDVHSFGEGIGIYTRFLEFQGVVLLDGWLFNNPGSLDSQILYGFSDVDRVLKDLFGHLDFRDMVSGRSLKERTDGFFLP